MTQRRVFFINRYFFPDLSATSQLLSELVFGIAGEVETHVVTSRLLYERGGRQLPSTEQIGRTQVCRLWSSAFGRGHTLRALDYVTFHASVFAFLVRNLRKGDVAVAKTDPPLLSVVVGMCAVIKGAKLVNWIQDLFPEVLERSSNDMLVRFIAAAVRPLRNWSLKVAAQNVVIGRLMAEIVRRAGVDPSRIAVIDNWTDCSRVAASDKNRLTRTWQLEGKFVVAYCGNMGRVHEFETLIDAARALAGNAGIVFLLVGGGHQRDRIERACLNAQLKNVVFKPYVKNEEVAELLAAADVHIVSLRPEFEGLIVPSKVFGAMAAGKPIIFIGAKTGEVSRIVQEHPASGISISIGDVEQLVQQLERLAEDEYWTRSLGQNARQRARANFDAAIALSRWNSLLSAL